MQVGTFNSELGRDQFLQLFVTQIRNQNPLEPLKNEDFMAQLAQFSTLEGIEKLNASFSSILSLSQLTQSSNLIGRNVVYQGANANLATGTVDGVQVERDALQLLVSGRLVPLDRVRGIVGASQ